MEYEIPSLGIFEISEEKLTIEANLDVSSEEFMFTINEKFQDLSKSSQNILKQVVCSNTPVKISPIDKMALSVFLGSLVISQSQEGLKNMRICGAAKFIPPKNHR